VSVKHLVDLDDARHDPLRLPAPFEYVFRLIAEKCSQVGIHGSQVSKCGPRGRLVGLDRPDIRKK
jgi:hypothetical protein